MSLIRDGAQSTFPSRELFGSYVLVSKKCLWKTRAKEVNLMANQMHLDLLSSGKILWNKWRRGSPDVQGFEPDLHGADLFRADLSRGELHGADLSEANLQGADLREAEV